MVWFALNDDRPLTAFAGSRTTFNGDRVTKSKPIPGPHQVYGFLTTSPNAVVEPIHPKAIPAILTTDEQREVWMCAPWDISHTLRHTSISWYLRAGVPIDKVSDYCGVSVTIIRTSYAHQLPGNFDGVHEASHEFGKTGRR